MTRINFKRTGGITGREMETDIDLTELPADEQQQLMQLIAETNFFSIPQNLVQSTKPDEHEYTITVDSGNTHHTIQTTDSTAPESLRPLLEKLSRLAKPG